MSNQRFLTPLKWLILIAPLPFGCVGPVFSPLFYLAVLVLSFIGLNQIRFSGYFLYQKWVQRLFYLLLGFLLFQILPLPMVLLKMISPATAAALKLLRDPLPSFHSLSLVPGDTLLFALRLAAMAMLFWVTVNLRLRKHELLSLMRVMIFSAAFQGFFGLIKYVLGNKYFFLFFYPDTESSSLDRLTGTLGNVDHFAFWMGMILPLVLALLFLKIRFLDGRLNLRERVIAAMNTDRETLVFLVIAVLLGGSIYLTGSRAGIVTMILMFLVFGQLSIFVKQSSNVRRRLKFVFVAITLFTMFLGLQNALNRFMDTRIQSGGRFLRWPNTVTMVSDHPLFGTGFGTYPYAYFLYDTDPHGGWSTHAHSDVLEILSDGGVLGALIFLALLAAVLYSIFHMWGMRRHPEVKMVGIGIIASLFAVSVHSLFDFALRIPSNVLMFVLILALGIQWMIYKKDFMQVERDIQQEKIDAKRRPVYYRVPR